MNNLNWRTLLTFSVVMALVVILVNVAFSAMWGHGAPNGAYGNGPFGRGTMMGPWMWGGMGFFWIFPIIGFVFMLIFFGVIARAFFGNTGQSQPTGSGPYGSVPSVPHAREACRNCGQAIEAGWIACPHCGTARAQSGQLEARLSSEEPKKPYD